MSKIKTDSNTEVGIAVGLIDSIINSARILNLMITKSIREEIDKRNKLPTTMLKRKFVSLQDSKELKEALKDFNDDLDIKHLKILGFSATGEKIKL